MSVINAWKPEEDVVLHQALGKLAEECSELAKIATRCMIQGYAETDPGTEKLNRTQLMEEVADVRATMRWLFDVLDIPFKGESPREARKFDGFKQWEAMLRADTPPATGIEVAARFIEKRRDDYVQEHGSYDPSTGMTEFPGNGEEYVYELEEIIDGIRKLAPPTKQETSR